MTESTGVAAWGAVIVSSAAALGIPPEAVVCATIGSGVGLVLGAGLGRWAAILMAGLMILVAPIMSAWATTLWPERLGQSSMSVAGLSLVLAIFAPIILRGLMHHMPEIVEAVLHRVTSTIRGDRK